MRKAFVALAFVLAAGCGGDSSTGLTGNASFAGTYNLSTVNGSALPFVIQATGPKIEITSDQIIANSGGTFSQTTSIRITNGTAVTTQTVSDGGTYTLNGTAASFRFNSDGSTGTGTVSGNTLIVADGGFSSLYLKQ